MHRLAEPSRALLPSSQNWTCAAAAQAAPPPLHPHAVKINRLHEGKDKKKVNSFLKGENNSGGDAAQG